MELLFLSIIAINDTRVMTAEGSNSYIVAVGAAHYINDGSVMDQLMKMGYEIN